MKKIILNNIKEEKKFFTINKIENLNLNKLKNIEIVYKNNVYHANDSLSFDKVIVDKKLNEIKKKKVHYFYFLYLDNNLIGKIYKNKKNFTIYLFSTFIEKVYNINIEKKEKSIIEKINKEKLLESLLNNDINEFVLQCSKIIDVVLHKKKIKYHLYDDIKQDLIIKSLNFFEKKEKYKLLYNKDKIFSYLYKMISNYLINLLKRKIYNPEIFYI